MIHIIWHSRVAAVGRTRGVGHALGVATAQAAARPQRADRDAPGRAGGPAGPHLTVMRSVVAPALASCARVWRVLLRPAWLRGSVVAARRIVLPREPAGNGSASP